MRFTEGSAMLIALYLLRYLFEPPASAGEVEKNRSRDITSLSKRAQSPCILNKYDSYNDFSDTSKAANLQDLDG